MQLFADRLANGAILVRQPDSNFVSLLDPNANEITWHGLPEPEYAALLAAAEPAVLDALIEQYRTRFTSRSTGVVWAHLDVLIKICRSEGYTHIKRSDRDPNPVALRGIRTSTIQKLGRSLCSRDEDCVGAHTWISAQAGRYLAVWHLDLRRATVVPPSPFLFSVAQS